MSEHSPSPTPERAVYGFVLYVATYLLFGLYILWAYLPEYCLTKLGITYLPQRFWVFGGPVYCCVTFLFVLFCYVSWNLFKTPSFNSTSMLTDQYTRKAPEKLPSGKLTSEGYSVPPLGDIDIITNHKFHKVANDLMQDIEKYMAILEAVHYLKDRKKLVDVSSEGSLKEDW